MVLILIEIKYDAVGYIIWRYIMKHININRFKKMISVFVCFILIFSFAGCTGNDSETTSPTITTEDSTKAEKTSLKFDNQDEIKTFRNNKDGLELSVSIPKTVKANNGFTLIAIVKNTTDKEISYYMPYYEQNMNLEIAVSIMGSNDKAFTDFDTYGKPLSSAIRIAKLAAGEVFAETIRFIPGYPDSNSGSVQQGVNTSAVAGDGSGLIWFTPGSYTGKAVFTKVLDAENYSNTENHVVLQTDFSVTVV